MNVVTFCLVMTLSHQAVSLRPNSTFTFETTTSLPAEVQKTRSTALVALPEFGICSVKVYRVATFVSPIAIPAESTPPPYTSTCKVRDVDVQYASNETVYQLLAGMPIAPVVMPT